jgi:hypothetical protein
MLVIDSFLATMTKFKNGLKSRKTNQGRAIAQAVSRAARVCARAEHVGFVVDKVALGQVFSKYFGFPCQSSFHQILHHNRLGLAQ